MTKKLTLSKKQKNVRKNMFDFSMKTEDVIDVKTDAYIVMTDTSYNDVDEKDAGFRMYGSFVNIGIMLTEALAYNDDFMTITELALNAAKKLKEQRQNKAIRNNLKIVKQ